MSEILQNVSNAFPGYVTFGDLDIVGHGNTGAVFTANNVFLMPVKISLPTPIAHVWSRVSSAGAAGSKIAFAFYDSSGNLLFQSSLGDGTIVTNQSIAMTGTLNPGSYWCAFTCSANLSMSSWQPGVGSADPPSGSGLFAFKAVNTSSGGTFPATLGGTSLIGGGFNIPIAIFVST